MLTIVARGRLKPDAKARFLELAEELVPASRAETGCHAYALHENLDDPGSVAFIEIWEDEDALERHTQTKHYTLIVPQLGGLLVDGMEVVRYARLV